MTYPRDIPQLVNDLAATPGVHRVFIVRLDGERLSPVAVWQTKFISDEPVLLLENHILHIEGEWLLESVSDAEDCVYFLNLERERIGLRPLQCIGETTAGKFTPRGWSGDIQIGFDDSGDCF